MKVLEYRLDMFSDEEIGRAKTYVAAAVIGLMRIKLRDYVDEMFGKLEGRTFTAYDKINFTVDFETIGNDILAAMGAAKEELEKKNGT
jgi:hypothetical protein